MRNRHHLDHPLLRDASRYGIKFGLGTVRRVLAALGNPHRSLNAIHLAGTNGKGSTAHMIAACLDASGYATGLYTSPHLFCVCERVRMNGRPMSAKKMRELLDEIEERVRVLRETGKIRSITYFEVLTVLAFLWFQRSRAEYAVIETGMGGRLDATNVLAARHVVLTGVGHDHERFLGKTLLEIGMEKVAIVHGRARVTAGKVPSRVMNAWTGSRPRAHFEFSARDFNATPRDGDPEKLVYRSRGGLDGFCFRPGLKGVHQAGNAALALRCLENLERSGAVLFPGAMRRKLGRLRLRGRFDAVREQPPLLFDGAHNPQAFRVLARNLDVLYPGVRFHAVCGFSGDRKVPSMLRELFPRIASLTAAAFSGSRAMPLCEWLGWARDNAPCPVYAADTPRAALDRLDSGRGVPVVVCGSLYLLEHAYAWWAKRRRRAAGDAAEKGGEEIRKVSC